MCPLHKKGSVQTLRRCGHDLLDPGSDLRLEGMEDAALLMQSLGQLFQPGDSAQLLEAFIPDGRKGLAVIAGRITQKVVDALIIRFQDLLDILPVVFQQSPVLRVFRSR